MSPFPLEYLRHISDETKYLMDRVEGLSKQEFIKDDTLKRAFVRSMPIRLTHKYSTKNVTSQ